MVLEKHAYILSLYFFFFSAIIYNSKKGDVLHYESTLPKDALCQVLRKNDLEEFINVLSQGPISQRKKFGCLVGPSLVIRFGSEEVVLKKKISILSMYIFSLGEGRDPSI